MASRSSPTRSPGTAEARNRAAVRGSSKTQKPLVKDHEGWSFDITRERCQGRRDGKELRSRPRAEDRSARTRVLRAERRDRAANQLQVALPAPDAALVLGGRDVPGLLQADQGAR